MTESRGLINFEGISLLATSTVVGVRLIVSRCAQSNLNLADSNKKHHHRISLDIKRLISAFSFPSVYVFPQFLVMYDIVYKLIA